MMQRIRMVCAVAGLAGCMATGVALGQAPATAVPTGPTGPAAEVQRSYAGLKANILKAADKMPGEDYSFKPTPDVRTFARVVNHVSESQLRICGAVNHTAADALAKVPAETADKAAIVEALKASYAECDKAYASATDANLGDTFDLFNAKRSRIGALWGNVSHDNEQYATLALYLRLKGLVPPSSEK
jgi:DinB superfamily